MRPHAMYEGETTSAGVWLPAEAESPPPSPHPGDLATPAASGQTSCGGQACTQGFYRAWTRLPSPRPSGRGARQGKQAAPPCRDAERAPLGNGGWKRQGARTKLAKPYRPLRSAGPLTAAGARRRLPLPAGRRVRGRQALLPPTLILLSTPLLSSVCTSRSRSSVSSSVAAAAILFLPDNRPNCASGGSRPADSPRWAEAPTPRRTRGEERRGDTAGGSHPRHRSGTGRREAAAAQRLCPPQQLETAPANKQRGRRRRERRAGSLKRGGALTAGRRDRRRHPSP